jgi:LysM repeat protein
MLFGLAACSILFGSSSLVGGASPLLQTAPTLGTASTFAVLSATTVTNTGPTVITGDVGVSPGTAITGFPPGSVTGGTIHAGDLVASQAHSDIVTAYGVLAGSTSPPASIMAGDLGGLTLLPGVYHFNTSATLTGILTLDAQGDPNAVFVFQIGTTLTTASNSAVQLINGASFDNAFWQVGGNVTIGTGTAFRGTILANTSITFTTGASLHGRALALNGAVTLDTNTIVAGATTTTLAPLPSTNFGQTATFNATVSPTAATGIVRFKDGSTTLGTGPLNGGVATFSTIGLTGGSHSITAVYEGDVNYSASTSSALTHIVNLAPTLTILAPLGTSTVGQNITLSTSVVPMTTTGTATFKDGATTLGTGTLSGGVATFSTAALPVGSHSITAVYGGDLNFATSTSSALIQLVTTVTTTTTLVLQGSTTFGQPGTLTATVAIAAPSTGTPTGQVAFLDGSTSLGAVVLDGAGLASFTPAPTQLAVGAHSITAQFGGSASLASSSSSALAATVTRAISITTLAVSPSSSQSGDTVTLSATVASTVLAAGTPSGNVVFLDNGNTLVSVAVDGTGVATFSTGALGAGTHTLTAQYAGDTNFDGTLASSALVVSAPPSSGGGSSGGGVSHSNPSPAAPAEEAAGGGGGPAASAPPRPLSLASPAAPAGTGAFVASTTLTGVATDASALGVALFQALGAPNDSGQGEVRIDPTVLALLANTVQLRLVVSQPSNASPVELGALGGGVAEPLGLPLNLSLLTIDRGSGQTVSLPDQLAGSSVEVRLPIPAVQVGPGQRVTWLMELDGLDGNFLGYTPAPTYDPVTQQLVVRLLASQLRDTLFLPVILSPAFVRNTDAAVHIWSSALPDAVDFGVSAPQFTRMQVLAPQIGGRLLVLNAFTGNPGWIDVGGVGPVAADDGLPAVLVPPAQAAPPTDPDAGTPTAQPTDAHAGTTSAGPADTDASTPPAVEPTTYTVQPGDTLKAIAGHFSVSLAELVSANPLIDPDNLAAGQELQLPAEVAAFPPGSRVAFEIDEYDAASRAPRAA